MILFQSGVEGAGEAGVEDGGCKGEGEDEDAADGAHDGRGEGAQAAEERRDTDKDLDCCTDDCHDVRDVHPFCCRFVRVEPVSELITEQMIRSGLVEMPDIHRVEPKLLLSRTAVCDVVEAPSSAISGEATGTIVPKADMVEIVDTKGVGDRLAGYLLEFRLERAVRQVVEKCAIGDNVGGVGTEKVEAVGDMGVFVGSTDTDNDEGDQGDDGQGHGCENTRETTKFPHLRECC